MYVHQSALASRVRVAVSTTTHRQRILFTSQFKMMVKSGRETNVTNQAAVANATGTVALGTLHSKWSVVS